MIICDNNLIMKIPKPGFIIIYSCSRFIITVAIIIMLNEEILVEVRRQ